MAAGGSQTSSFEGMLGQAGGLLAGQGQGQPRIPAFPGQQPRRTPQQEAQRLARKGYLSHVAAMLESPKLELSACKLLSAAGTASPGVLDDCAPALVRGLPLVLGGGSGGAGDAPGGFVCSCMWLCWLMG